jgi:hypothetical protein
LGIVEERPSSVQGRLLEHRLASLQANINSKALGLAHNLSELLQAQFSDDCADQLGFSYDAADDFAEIGPFYDESGLIQTGVIPHEQGVTEARILTD